MTMITGVAWQTWRRSLSYSRRLSSLCNPEVENVISPVLRMRTKVTQRVRDRLGFHLEGLTLEVECILERRTWSA